MTTTEWEKSELIHSRLSSEFKHNSNPEHAGRQEAYMKYQMPFWGIPAHQVEEIAYSVFNQHPPLTQSEYRHLLRYLFVHGSRREEWYAAILMSRKFKKFIHISNVDLYIEIVQKSQWWDIVDTIAVNLIGPSLVTQDLRKWLIPWINHPDIWVRRTALLTQLKYREKTDYDVLKELIRTIEHETEFFIRKAIGWALREYAYTDPAAVSIFVDERAGCLSNLSVREAQKGLNKMRFTS